MADDYARIGDSAGIFLIYNALLAARMPAGTLEQRGFISLEQDFDARQATFTTLRH